MTNPVVASQKVDRKLIAWTVVWSMFLSVVAYGLLRDSYSPQVTRGAILGALAAVWIVAASWSALIELPRKKRGATTYFALPRIGMILFLLLNISLLSVGLRHRLQGLSELLLTVAFGFLATIIAFLWTQQRIHRGGSKQGRRGIRHIMWITAIIALLITMIQFSGRWTELTLTQTAMAAGNVMFWTVAACFSLGRWPSLTLLAVGLIPVQYFVGWSLLNTVNRNADLQMDQFAANNIAFAIFSLLFLALMRSGGHRWIGKNGSGAGT